MKLIFGYITWMPERSRNQFFIRTCPGQTFSMDTSSDILVNSNSKTIAIVFAIVSMVILTPLLLSIIRYERNKHHRTLINQLMASTIWTATAWNLTIQPLAIYRTALGPMKYEIVCHVNSVLRNSLPMHAVLLLDATMLVKYAFSFHMKNPTAVQDDFWNRFLNLVIFCITVLSQIVHVLQPGREAHYFYICVGKTPDISSSSFTKLNYSVIFVVIVSAFIHLIFGSKYFYMKILLNKEERHQVFTTKTNFNMSADIFISYTTNGLIAILLLGSFVVLANVNEMDFKSLSENPHWFYALYMYLPTAVELATVVYFLKSSSIRNHIKQEFFEVFQLMFGQISGTIYPIHNI